jgi:four helix bundle protein
MLTPPGMNPKAEALKARSAAFAVSVVRLCRTVPESHEFRRMTGQLIDAATSMAQNYRAACRARSRKEFVAKIGVVVEEADECQGWLALLVETGGLSAQQASGVIHEADQLTAIFAKSYHTAKGNRQSPNQLPDPPIDNPQ